MVPDWMLVDWALATPGVKDVPINLAIAVAGPNTAPVSASTITPALLTANGTP